MPKRQNDGDALTGKVSNIEMENVRELRRSDSGDNITEVAVPEEQNKSGHKTANIAALSDGLTAGDFVQLVQATQRLQRWYRKYQAGLEQKRRVTWKVYSEMEYADEQNELALYNCFSAQLNKKLPDVEDMDSSFSFKIVDDPAKSGANRLRLRFPLNLKEVQRIIDHYRQDEPSPIHMSYLVKIFQTYRAILMNMKNVHRTESRGKPVTVVGDTHGFYEDLMMIFDTAGKPGETMYVFNGDFVDRGEKGLEVLVVLVCYAILYPESFILNRGNHEDSAVNEAYGFADEVRDKYPSGDAGDSILAVITDLFRWLPLAVVIDNSVLVVHGGISPEFTLATLNQIDRKQFPSVLVPPSVPAAFDSILRYFKKMSTQQLEEFERDADVPFPEIIWHWRFLMTLLWSDPSPNPGHRVNLHRGGGVEFGPDVTNEFLKRNGLKMLIRSHQCKPEGYEFEHDRRCLTVFSASNYYDQDSNKGAVVKFLPTASHTVDFHQPQVILFQMNDSETRSSLRADIIRDQNKHALANLRQNLIMNMAKIEHEIRKSDHEGDIRYAVNAKSSMQLFVAEDDNNDAVVSGAGQCEMDVWSRSCKNATGLDVPWKLLEKDLPLVTRHDQLNGLVVDYETTFLRILEKSEGSNESARRSIFTKRQSLYRPKHRETAKQTYECQRELNRLFEKIDVDGSGTIEKHELKAEAHLVPLFEGYQIDRLIEIMDSDKDGLIDLNEFIDGFRLISNGRVS